MLTFSSTASAARLAIHLSDYFDDVVRYEAIFGFGPDVGRNPVQSLGDMVPKQIVSRRPLSGWSGLPDADQGPVPVRGRNASGRRTDGRTTAERDARSDR